MKSMLPAMRTSQTKLDVIHNWGSQASISSIHSDMLAEERTSKPWRNLTSSSGFL